MFEVKQIAPVIDRRSPTGLEAKVAAKVAAIVANEAQAGEVRREFLQVQAAAFTEFLRRIQPALDVLPAWAAVDLLPRTGISDFYLRAMGSTTPGVLRVASQVVGEPKEVIEGDDALAVCLDALDGLDLFTWGPKVLDALAEAAELETTAQTVAEIEALRGFLTACGVAP